MSQLPPEGKSQTQENVVKDNTIGGNLTFAPQQIETYIETQIVEISAEKVTQQKLIKSSPYKGLKRFNFGDREYFFGRDALITKLFKAVNKSTFSLVLGASGSGKSSVVRAGLIPELKKSLASQKFYNFIFTPNQDPFESLYRSLLSEEKDYDFSESDVYFVREGKPNTLAQLINKLKSNGEKWFLFIDQFEQLFTTCTDLEKRNNFIKGIVQVAKQGDSSVRIVLAMRSDFLEQFSFYPTLGEIANQNNLHLVTEMYPDELRQAIEQPAAKHGVVFEKGLVEQIIKEVEGQKGYLPLLQYTLDLLWESECIILGSDGRLHIEDRILNKTSYAALEGVRGALQKRVNDIYKDISEKNEDGELVTKQIFLKLVDIVESESGSKAVSRRAYRDEFVSKSVESTLQRFVDENLLVSSYEYSSEEKLLIGNSTKSIQHATVEIAHEILLSSWDKLKSWLEEEKEIIILKNWLAGEKRRWQNIREEHGELQAKSELLRGARLEQISALQKSNAFKKLGGLSDLEEKYLKASLKWREIQERQVKRRRWTTMLVLSSFSTVAIILGTIARLQTLEANRQLSRAQVAELSTRALSNQDTHLDKAIIQARDASQRGMEIGFIDEPRRSLYSSLYRFPNLQRIFHHPEVPFYRVAVSPSGQYVAAISEESIYVWDINKGELLLTLSPLPLSREDIKPGTDYTRYLSSPNISRAPLRFSADESSLLIRGFSLIWQLDLSTGEASKLPKFYSSAGFIDLTVSATNGIVGAVDATGVIWLSDPELGTVKRIEKDAITVAIAPDGQSIAYVVKGNPASRQFAPIHICAMDGTNDRAFTMEDASSPDIYLLRFNPNGAIVASLGDEIFLWNSTSGRLMKRGTVSHAYIIDAAFSPDGQTLISASSGGTVLASRVSGGRNFGRSLSSPLKVIDGGWKGHGKADISDNSKTFASIIGNGNSIIVLSTQASDLTFPSLQGESTENTFSEEESNSHPISELLDEASNKLKVNLEPKLIGYYKE